MTNDDPWLPNIYAVCVYVCVCSVCSLVQAPRSKLCSFLDWSPFYFEISSLPEPGALWLTGEPRAPPASWSPVMGWPVYTSLQTSCKAAALLTHLCPQPLLLDFLPAALVPWFALSLDKNWELKDRRKTQTLAQLFFCFSPCWWIEHTPCSARGEVRGQLGEVVLSFHHLKAGSQTQVIHQAWQQGPLRTQPSWHPFSGTVINVGPS